MNFHKAQQEFVSLIKSAASKVNPYLWRLSGDEPNSLCKFLGLKENELKAILRLLRIYNGNNNDNFSKNNFELLMLMCKPDVDWVPYRINNKPERFIKIGPGGKELCPKDFYDTSGSLRLYPVVDEHIPTFRTKSQRSMLMQLLAVGGSAATMMNNNNEISDKLLTKPIISPLKSLSLRKACYLGTSKNL